MSPPKQSGQKANSTVLEARSCLLKIKHHISSSKNLKTEIKTGVLEAVERLYQLVKVATETQGPSTAKQPIQQKTKEISEIGTREEKTRQEREWKEMIGKHTELLKENNEKMENLKEMLSRKTYASAAAATPRRQFQGQTALHSVVVTAKDDNETGEEILNKIRKVVNAKEGGVSVERVRKAKDRKVIVGCRTEEERRKIKDRLSKAPELNVEEIKNKDPLVILRNVLQHNSDDDILKALRNQNKNLFKEIEANDTRIEVAFKKRTRNPHTCHIVLRVSTKMWQRMLGAEAVHIDLQRVRVEDQSPLVQCSLCLGYGHGRRFCTETIEKCSHCGGPHMRTQCEEWMAGGPPTCCNCLHAKLEKTDHNAFSSECAVRRKWDALARASVAYC